MGGGKREGGENAGESFLFPPLPPQGDLKLASEAWTAPQWKGGLAPARERDGAREEGRALGVALGRAPVVGRRVPAWKREHCPARGRAWGEGRRVLAWEVGRRVLAWGGERFLAWEAECLVVEHASAPCREWKRRGAERKARVDDLGPGDRKERFVCARRSSEADAWRSRPPR